MKVIIAGSRGFGSDSKTVEEDYCTFLGYMSILPVEFGEITEVVSGGARGTDTMGEWFSELNRIKCTRFIPDWTTHGKRAGPLRNIEMGDYADALIAFWDGKSKGTKQMIEYMKKLNKPYHVFMINE